MKYELVQKTMLPNGEVEETNTTSPDGTTLAEALAAFNEMCAKTYILSTNASRYYKCELKGSIELFEIDADGTKGRLRLGEYETKP
jgi:hypothetical protein